MADVDAFLLLTLPNVTLYSQSTCETGTLALECVTLPGDATESDVYLVLKLNSFEAPLDPMRPIQCIPEEGARSYFFNAEEMDEIHISFAVATQEKPDVKGPLEEDYATFDAILTQYTELRGSEFASPILPSPDYYLDEHASRSPLSDTGGLEYLDAPEPPPYAEDMRGHLVLVNEDNGEVVGTVDDRELHISQEANLGSKTDPVVIELDETENSGADGARAVFIRAIPPHQQNWMTTGATIIRHVYLISSFLTCQFTHDALPSHGITAGTNLLLKTITSATESYIAKSAPASNSNAPPSRALTMFTSPRTRQGLAVAHTVTGHAVKVSGATILMIENMIRRATKNPRRDDLAREKARQEGYMYQPDNGKKKKGKGKGKVTGPPPLPPRSQTAPVLPVAGPSSGPPPLPSREKINIRQRLRFSADLILQTLDDSTRRILDTGVGSVTDIVEHKYVIC
jgi:spartin